MKRRINQKKNIISGLKVLAIIQARSGSKRVPNKNIKNFLGKPLIAYTIEQALSCVFVDRVVVDTDSPKIKKIAEKYGAEIPFLRPRYLATDKAQGIDSVLYLIKRLMKEENYMPDYVLNLPLVAPLRDKADIEDCWKLIRQTRADSVVTVYSGSPRIYYLDSDQNLALVNGSKKERQTTNTQEWRAGYYLNNGVFLTKTDALLREKNDITKKTKAMIYPKWRSVDIDTPEDWAIAEVLYKNRQNIVRRIKQIKPKSKR
ncbi:MAG: acylneuraminate cytidylyltransferase family protein [Candidatus Niyogibacteria bacterium]|nr:acylneuraminate cytidylyltransferase family protein [Candidatus Niyogibacteria bacterium]